MKLMASLWLVGISACAQQQPAIRAETKGACSPANTGDNNTFNISCGIGKAQGDQMIKILNKILAHQLEPVAVMEKLDEILKEVGKRHLTETQIGDLNTFAKSEFNPGQLRISWVMENDESEQYAADFSRAFDKAVGEIGNSTFAPRTPHGLFVVVKDKSQLADTRTRGLVDRLLKRLDSLGLDPKGDFYPGLKPSQIELLVGAKP
jgi:hypothetical protein